MSEVMQNVLIDIDALIDTRVALIFQKFPSKFRDMDLYKFVTRNHNRVWDVIGVTEEEWMEVWDDRDSIVFESAKPTNLLVNLKQIIVSKYVEGNTSPVHNRLVLDINVYPYHLDTASRVEVIESVREWTFEDLTINVVSIAPKTLTPTYIKARYQSLFMLDWITWITAHSEELKTTKIPTVTFNVPAYIHDANPELHDVIGRMEVDPVSQLQRYMAEFMSLKVNTVTYFRRGT